MRLDAWYTVVNVLCHHTQYANDRSPLLAFQTSLVEFYRSIVYKRARIACLSAAWDISTQARRSLALTRGHFFVDYLDGPNCETLYIIRRAGITYGDWIVASYEAATIVLSFRLDWDTLDELVVQLVRLNVGFYMPRYISRQNVGWPFDIPNRPGLGWRPERYTPTRDDYPAYVRQRHGVLRSSHGRRCLMTGGIVGRIASGIVPEKYVLEGPTYHNKVLVSVAVGTSNEGVLAEDDTPNNIFDIVCGVYYIGHNDENLSWFPKKSAWESKAGQHIGQWTPDAEHWYQNHLKDIAQYGKLYNASQWKADIRKYASKSKGIVTGFNKLAEEYIHDVVYQSTRR